MEAFGSALPNEIIWLKMKVFSRIRQWASGSAHRAEAEMSETPPLHSRENRRTEAELKSLELLHQSFEQTLKGRCEFEVLDLEAMRQTLRILETLAQLAKDDPNGFFHPSPALPRSPADVPSGSQTATTTRAPAGSPAEAIAQVFDFLKAQKEYWAGRDDTAQNSLDGSENGGGGPDGTNIDETDQGGGDENGSTNDNGGEPEGQAGDVRLGGGLVTLPDGSVGVAGTAHGSPEGSTVEILNGHGEKIGEIPNATDSDGRFSGFFPPDGPLRPGTDVSLKVGETILPVGPIPPPIPVSF